MLFSHYLPPKSSIWPKYSSTSPAKWATVATTVCSLLFSANSSIGQIVPDRSLGEESSRITPTSINGLPTDRIDGGAIRGSNLFHSFGEFNIGEGRGASAQASLPLLPISPKRAEAQLRASGQPNQVTP